MWRARLSTFFLAAVAFAGPGWAQSATSPGEAVRNYKTAGNLASTYALDCISLAEVKNAYTPADLYPAVAKCVQSERYKEATELFMIAGTYSNFDTLRVVDRTAHQGIAVLIQNAAWSVDRQKWSEWAKIYQTELNEQRNVAVDEACHAIRRIGPPAYYPDYMIQHGMRATMQAMEATQPDVPKQPAGDALVSPFDPKQAWEKALGGRCSKS